MEYEVVLEPQMNPVVVGVAVFAILIFSVILFFIYIPRIDQLSRLQKENEKLKKQRDELAEKLAIEIVEKHYIYSEYVELLTAKDGRIKQAEDRATVFAVLCDELKELKNKGEKENGNSEEETGE